MAKKSKTKKENVKYQLNINECLMYAIQGATGQSTFQIVSYFNELMMAQKKDIQDATEEAVLNNSWQKPVQKKGYAFYPNTKIYFVATTTWKDVENIKDNGIFGEAVESRYRLWECNVALPRTMAEFDHEKLKTLLAEGILIGDAEPDVKDPSDHKTRKIYTIPQLQEDSTDSKES